MEYIHPVTQREYTVTFSADDYMEAPEMAYPDSHGVIVRLDHDIKRYDYSEDEMLTDEEKMRMALYRPLGPSLNTWDHVYYDYIGSLHKAVKEWGRTEADAPAAVEQDYNYLRGWYQGEWHWCIVTATTTVDGREFTNSIGGYESTIEPDTLDEILRDITHDIEQEIKRDAHKNQLELAFA